MVEKSDHTGPTHEETVIRGCKTENPISRIRNDDQRPVPERLCADIAAILILAEAGS